jgi:hypothetical protein
MAMATINLQTNRIGTFIKRKPPSAMLANVLEEHLQIHATMRTIEIYTHPFDGQ